MISRAITAAAMAFGLAACSSEQSTEPSNFELLRGALGGMVSGLMGGEDAQPAGLSISPEMVASSPTPLLVAAVPATGGQALMAPLLSNGNRDTWGSNDGITVTSVDGVVVGTRGLGYDLMGADTGGLRAVIAAGGGETVRINDRLNGLGVVERLPYACEVVIEGRETIPVIDRQVAATKVSETCRGGQVAFQNLYWIEDSGFVRQSQQWVNEEVQYLVVQILKDS